MLLHDAKNRWFVKCWWYYVVLLGHPDFCVLVGGVGDAAGSSASRRSWVPRSHPPEQQWHRQMSHPRQHVLSILLFDVIWVCYCHHLWCCFDDLDLPSLDLYFFQYVWNSLSFGRLLCCWPEKMVHSSQHSCCKVAFGRCRLLQALTPGTVELTAGSYYSIAWGKTWNRRHKSRSAFPTGPMRWKKRKMRIFAPSPFLCSWFSGVQKDGTKNLGVFHRCACWSWFKAIPRSYLLPTMNVEQILVGFWDMMFSLCVLYACFIV